MILNPLPLLLHLIKTLNSRLQFSCAADQLTCSVPSLALSFVELSWAEQNEGATRAGVGLRAGADAGGDAGGNS